MSYRIFTNPDDLRVIAIDDDGDGFLFTPDTEYKRQISKDRLVYSDMGSLYVWEELFGAHLDTEKVEEAWRAVNDYWSNQFK